MSATAPLETLVDLVGSFSPLAESTAINAFRDGGMEEWSYGRLADSILRLAAGLHTSGVKHQEPVLLFAPNSPEWIVAYLASISVGAIVVPVDIQASDDDIQRVLDDTGCRWIFSFESQADRLWTLTHSAPPRLVFLDPAPANKCRAHWTALLADPLSPPASAVVESDVASILYTSGTTGRPKAVPLTHQNFMSNVTALTAAGLARSDDRVLLPLPLHHAYAFTVGMLGSLATGATLVLPAGTSGPEIVDALKRANVTILIGVPRLYEALVAGIDNQVKAYGPGAFRLYRIARRLALAVRRLLGLRVGRRLFAKLHKQLGPQLRIVASGGAKLDPDLFWKLEALGWHVLTGYGLTETSPILTYNLRHRSRAGSVGRPIDGVEIKINKDQDKEDGEILARGPNVFSGYQNNPQANKQAFTESGWFRTGDLGHLDRQGYLYVLSRAKDILVLPGGENIILEEIEKHFDQSPYIAETAIVESDGKLTALVRPDYESIRKRGAARAESLIRDEIAERNSQLASFQRVSGYRLVREPLPRTRLGKLQRHLLGILMESAQRSKPPLPDHMTKSDAALLNASPAKEIFVWLQERFPDTPLSLDTSPQLDLGIDSLGWMSLTFELQETFHVSITEDALARIITMRDLLEEIRVSHTIPASVEQSPDFEQVSSAEDEAWFRPRGVILGVVGLILWTVNWIVFHSLWRVHVSGAKNIPRNTGVVLTPNHVSYFDGFALAASLSWMQLRRMSWAGWTGLLFSGPFGRLLSRAAGILPVDPDQRPANALALGRAALEKDRVLTWFPEGRRSPDGEIGAFREGIGLLLDQAPKQVVPVIIDGTFDVWPIGQKRPRLGPIKVSFGSPMGVEELEANGDGSSRAQRITNGLRQHMIDLRRKKLER